MPTSLRTLVLLPALSSIVASSVGCAATQANAGATAPVEAPPHSASADPPPPRPSREISRRYGPVSLDGFYDAIHHYQNESDTSDYERYAPEQVVEIATNILLYQRLNGGWPSNFDPTRILTDKEARKIWKKRGAKDTTLDNRSTYTHTEYLAGAYGRTDAVQFRDGAYRGLDFILRSQTPSGGWPHSYPNHDGYRPHVTLLDDVMVGVLRMLRKAAAGAEPFAFLDARWRERCDLARQFGDETLLRLQIRQGKTLTAWAAQYDRNTLRPTRGRTFELPALVSAESVGVVRYLMSVDDPSPQMQAAIRAAVAWFERSKIEGIRLDRIAVAAKRHAHHTSSEDVVVVKDPDAPPLWARFYDLDTNRPFFANRDGKKVYKLSQVDRERRTGYSWYSSAPTKLLKREYPAWAARWGETDSSAAAR